MASSRENAPSGMEEKMEEKTRSSRLVQVRSRLISRAPTESEKLKVMLIVWDSSFIVCMRVISDILFCWESILLINIY